MFISPCERNIKSLQVVEHYEEWKYKEKKKIVVKNPTQYYINLRCQVLPQFFWLSRKVMLLFLISLVFPEYYEVGSDLNVKHIQRFII